MIDKHKRQTFCVVSDILKTFRVPYGETLSNPVTTRPMTDEDRRHVDELLKKKRGYYMTNNDNLSKKTSSKNENNQTQKKFKLPLDTLRHELAEGNDVMDIAKKYDHKPSYVRALIRRIEAIENQIQTDSSNVDESKVNVDKISFDKLIVTIDLAGKVSITTGE